jgi:asparagine synthase (glutamine-hydrolysing)
MTGTTSIPAFGHDDLARQVSAAGAVCVGNARFADPELASVAQRNGQAAAWTAAFGRFGAAAPAQATGDFAVAARDGPGRMMLAVDRFAIRSLCYRIDGNQLRFAERADELCGDAPDLDPQALFDYLYFHTIPAPRTIYPNVQRLPAGHCALFEGGALSVTPWWTPTFEENRHDSFERLREEFLALLEQSVAAQVDGKLVGCFLSGGTDSSTVAGVLGRVTGKPARTFSIGFDIEGYDEMEYARIAALHFGTEHHEYYMTPDDLVASIPRIARAYDQPFGNSSAAAVYHCASMAHDAGVDRMLAGDGGDELFGGNTRYAMQKIFGLYEQFPVLARTKLIEPLLGIERLARMPWVSKAASYVAQAQVRMPDRLQQYNLLVRLGLSEVLTPDFIGSIDSDEPLRQQRAWYDASRANTLVNRMLAYDWKYTLADNDIPKVVGATALAGVTAGFPLLDGKLVDFSMRLDPALKLNGFRLRWFFKQALRGFLPDRIIAKRKHGFGLPFGVWLTRHTGLRSLAQDALSSLRSRRIVRPEFIDELMTKHLALHPSYYGEMAWILMMYEHWQLARERSRSGGESPRSGHVGSR